MENLKKTDVLENDEASAASSPSKEPYGHKIMKLGAVIVFIGLFLPIINIHQTKQILYPDQPIEEIGESIVREMVGWNYTSRFSPDSIAAIEKTQVSIQNSIGKKSYASYWDLLVLSFRLKNLATILVNNEGKNMGSDAREITAGCGLIRNSLCFIFLLPCLVLVLLFSKLNKALWAPPSIGIVCGSFHLAFAATAIVSNQLIFFDTSLAPVTSIVWVCAVGALITLVGSLMAFTRKIWLKILSAGLLFFVVCAFILSIDVIALLISYL